MSQTFLLRRFVCGFSCLCFGRRISQICGKFPRKILHMFMGSHATRTRPHTSTRAHTHTHKNAAFCAVNGSVAINSIGTDEDSLYREWQPFLVSDPDGNQWLISKGLNTHIWILLHQKRKSLLEQNVQPLQLCILRVQFRNNWKGHREIVILSNLWRRSLNPLTVQEAESLKTNWVFENVNCFANTALGPGYKYCWSNMSWNMSTWKDGE